MRRMLIFLGLWGALLFLGAGLGNRARVNPAGPSSVYEATGGCTDPNGAPRPCA